MKAPHIYDQEFEYQRHTDIAALFDRIAPGWRPDPRKQQQVKAIVNGLSPNPAQRKFEL